MDYEIGTELLIQMPGNKWLPAIVEEDDDDEIFVTYKEGNRANEWINKDSHRIKPMIELIMNNLTEIHSPSENMVTDFTPIISTPIISAPIISTPLISTPLISAPIISTPIISDIPEVISSPEKEITKKPTTSVRSSSSVFKVKFKKDDFLSKKTQDSKLKEQKSMKDAKKSADRESKQLLSNNISNNETNSLKHTIVENSQTESENIKVVESVAPLNLNESNLSKSDNFEELLEDIEAEAEICSPTKSISHNDIKQKKKRKRYFGIKKRKTSSKNRDRKKNLLVVKLNPLKRKDNILPDKLNNTDNAASPTPSKKIKVSLPTSNSVVNSSHQDPPSFHQLANNTLIQKIRMDASTEQGFRCPKQECRKLFRKENLLMMHIKHYHSEYTDLLVSTPNVTDLATARIEGENADELSPSYYLHRISQIEAKRSYTACNSPSSSLLSSSLKFTEQELENNTSFQSENYNTSFTSIDKTNNSTQAYDSKDSGIVDSVGLIPETPTKESPQIKEPIKKITLVDNFECETLDSYNTISVTSSGRHFKIKKKKSDIESLPKEEVINCSCGSNQEDGLMIQCDVCLCWQHGYCNKIDSESQVPENYICLSCLHPSKKRRSKQYDYLQDWIKEGKVASVLQNKDERRRKDENILKQSHQLVAEVIEHNNFLHSLLVKTVIYGQTPDHHKLYLWSEQSSTRNEEPLQNKLEELLSGPVPEKPINTSECRKNLLDEIEDGFDTLEARINLFEAKTNGLEDQVSGTIDNEVLSNTVTMLLRDLNSIQQYLSFDNQNNESDNV